MSECWERNINGELIPQKGVIERLDSKLSLEIDKLRIKYKDEKDEKNKEVLKEAIKLLEIALEKKSLNLEIEYTPLLYCEIKTTTLGYSCDGKKIEDVEADICAKHCSKPKRTYNDWRDMKNPIEKIEIAKFIMKNSLPEVIRTEEEDKVFQMLQRLV